MSKIEKGCLAMIIGAGSKECKKYIGQVHKVGNPCYKYSGCWDFDPPIYVNGVETSWSEHRLRRLDNPPDDAADLLLAPLPQQDKVPA